MKFKLSIETQCHNTTMACSGAQLKKRSIHDMIQITVRFDSLFQAWKTSLLTHPTAYTVPPQLPVTVK